MKQEKKVIFLMWLCFLLCSLAPIVGYEYADTIEEVATTVIFLAMAVLTDKVIAYLMLALSIGKLIDGQECPYGYGPNELIWDIISFSGAIVLYIYRRKKTKAR